MIFRPELKTYSSYLYRLVKEWRLYYWCYKMYNRQCSCFMDLYNKTTTIKRDLSPDEFYLECISVLEELEKKIAKYNVFAIVRAHKRYDEIMGKNGEVFPPSVQSQGKNLTYKEFNVQAHSAQHC